jgi:voltage-gated potassium channel Kch
MIAQLYGEDADTWLTRQEAATIGYDASNFVRYVSALYWAVTTMTTVGYGDITSVQAGERIFNIFAMVLGAR